ncbi:endonuclease III [Fibrobacter sp. UWEL]|uniref:endonuclease III n=1 Tax=Fibrobacter sp. UWEL TaxID=1896209 RepID=UPI00090F77F8|nr:endonuclease III [Fibrobacter sp. UWEL]SHK62312.1 DNA-(apurinic or apyrimidinic site) lyase /endonuclease III [Fibrobacter sp. UWEL]
MTKKEKIAFINQKLDELFPDPPIPLDYRDPYTLLVAVVLSAQCTDARVNLVTAELYKVADTPAKMVKLGVEGIAEYIKTCGLYQNKSKNIFKLSQILVEKYGGEVPRTFEDLEALPGVGHKTASVMMIHAFKVPAFPVDTHIHRLAARWGLSDGSTVERTEADLKKSFPPETWELKHLQIILFGRTYCKAMGHKVDQCPICSVIGCKTK